MAIAIVTTVIDCGYTSTHASEFDSVQTIIENGVEYALYVNEDANGRTVELINNDTNDKAVIEVSVKDSEMDITNYKYNGKNIFGQKNIRKFIVKSIA